MAKPKITGAPNAVGYWGRDPATHIAALQTGERVLALNRDKIYAMGLPHRVWLRVKTGLLTDDPRVVQCSCWNETAQQSDQPCLSCYGLRHQPGFFRFGYRTLFYSSIHQDLTLTNLQLNKVVTPFRLELTPGFTTGTIYTPIYTVTEVATGPLEVKLDAYPRDPSASIEMEVSTDGGTSWQNVGGSINWPQPTVVLTPQVGDQIQFRIALIKGNGKSPLFEILRARFPIVVSPRPREPLPAAPGDILLLKTWDVERFKREQPGNLVETEGERYWTLPLSFFDGRIDRETKDAVLGSDHFIEVKGGPEDGVRYIATRHSFSRNFKLFTRQDFNLRRIVGDPNNKQSGELIQRVW